MREYRGVAASPGLALGVVKVIMLDGERPQTEWADPASAEEEWHRLRTVQDELLEALREEVTQSAQGAEMLAAHAAILEDVTLVEMLQEAIAIERMGAERAVQAVFGDFAALFSALDDPLFAARAADVRDLQRQLLARLSGDPDDTHNPLADLPDGAVMVMREIMPSEVARLDATRVAGIALAEGSPLAHASILARSMGIPVVCRLGDEILSLCDGMDCLIDGNDGALVLEPDAGERARPAEWHVLSERKAVAPANSASVEIVAATVDRFPLPVLANLNTIDEVALVAQYGANGIGLLRTEFLFARHTAAPSVEEQTATYARILSTLGDLPCNVRAFDLGGDKRAPWLPAEEAAAGLRGIRLLFAHPQVLRDQYRALIRAVAAVVESHGERSAPVRFMLPMIALPEEVDAARRMLDEIASEEDPGAYSAIEIGVMVEIPSAALMAGEIAARCDYLSIGSNDLAQFLFAGDRTQRDASALANGLHPAVLRTIEGICTAAHKYAPIALCGEIAANPLATPLLLGLGVSEVSVTPSAVARVKAGIGQETLEACQRLASAALGASDTEGVLALLHAFAQKTGK